MVGGLKCAFGIDDGEQGCFGNVAYTPATMETKSGVGGGTQAPNPEPYVSRKSERIDSYLRNHLNRFTDRNYLNNAIGTGVGKEDSSHARHNPRAFQPGINTCIECNMLVDINRLLFSGQS